VFDSEFEGTLFKVERAGFMPALFFMSGSADHDRVSLNAVRSVCSQLDIPEDIFGIQH
jgi:hypothetical protein